MLIVKELRKNEAIRAREVFIIGEEGEKLGNMPFHKAISLARERGLDLVEVAPTANPPVCKLMDYGKYKYEQTKKERESRKNQKISDLREVRIRPKIGIHDLESKIKMARKFLAQGDKVKISLIFRGREITHLEFGKSLLTKVYDTLKNESITEAPVTREGHHMTVILLPIPQSQRKVVKQVKEPAKESTVAESKESKEVVDAKA